MSSLIADVIHEFQRSKNFADRAVANLTDEALFRRPGNAVNSIALIVKHLAGNLASRWTDLLTGDGEKPNRDRDMEFVLTPDDTRDSLLAAWNVSWETLFAALVALTEADLMKTVTIRGEPHRVQQALLRSLGHTAYHVGQIMYVARLLNPEAEYATIAPGKSQEHRPGYLQGPAGH